MLHAVCWTQALYFGATGLWPLVHYPSFAAVTGPKTDVWLVRTVGALIVAIALSLAATAVSARVGVESVALAVASSVALGVVDVAYVLRRVLSRIYLADALAEAALIAWWIAALASEGMRIGR